MWVEWIRVLVGKISNTIKGDRPRDIRFCLCLQHILLAQQSFSKLKWVSDSMPRVFWFSSLKTERLNPKKKNVEEDCFIVNQWKRMRDCKINVILCSSFHWHKRLVNPSTVPYPGLVELSLADDLGTLHHVLARPRRDALLDAAVAGGGGQVAGQPRVDAVWALDVGTHVATVRLSKGRYEITLRRKRSAMWSVTSRTEEETNQAKQEPAEEKWCLVIWLWSVSLRIEELTKQAVREKEAVVYKKRKHEEEK